ncbi:MAG: hypothetical protein FJY20_11430 [Bacteroidetes bacterium]|nr:hypothetical protein [Bacteroidota bacterium]
MPLSKILAFEQPIICSGSAITVKRDVFIKAGGFDERKELHPSEDWEFYYRVSSLSKTVCIQEPLVNYRNHGRNGHLKIRNMERAMKLVYKKIFSTASPEIYELKSKSYGNLYVNLSGSYFHARKTIPFFRSFFKSLWYNPLKIMYFFSRAAGFAKIKSWGMAFLYLFRSFSSSPGFFFRECFRKIIGNKKC